jgi:hypothetical protein
MASRMKPADLAPAGPWKRMVASKAYHEHNFPAPHVRSNRSSTIVVPPEKFFEIAAFDGSVIVERTAGGVSALP